jgi:hypothetical protein
MTAMKKVILYLLPLILLSVFSLPVLAQKVGSTSMQFLKVMPCARATAMGEAYSVLATGAEAVFWNPAGIADLQNRSTRTTEASISYVRWIFDTQQGALGIATSLGGWGSVGVQIQYIDFGSIDEAVWSSPYKDDIQYPGLTGRTFRPFAYMVGVTYAYQLTDKFSTGLTAKFAHESLYNGSVVATYTSQGDAVNVNTWADGIMFDFGLQYNTGYRSIRLAASVQNFGPNVTYTKKADASPVDYEPETNAIPLALRVGIAADIAGPNPLLLESTEHRFSAAFDLFQPNDYEQQAHMGVEYEFAGIVAFRGGYKFNYDADGITAGVGVKQNFAGAQLSVDYSYGALEFQLGNVHRISIGAGF